MWWERTGASATKTQPVSSIASTHLARGRNVAEGLRAAQLDLMATEPYANAGHWSAFAVLGDGASAPLPARHGGEWLSIGLLSSIAVIALAVFAARRLRR